MDRTKFFHWIRSTDRLSVTRGVSLVAGNTRLAIRLRWSVLRARLGKKLFRDGMCQASKGTRVREISSSRLTACWLSAFSNAAATAASTSKVRTHKRKWFTVLPYVSYPPRNIFRPDLSQSSCFPIARHWSVSLRVHHAHVCYGRTLFYFLTFGLECYLFSYNAFVNRYICQWYSVSNIGGVEFCIRM